MKNYEKVLPENYKEVMHIDAVDKKTGITLTLYSLLLLVLCLVVCFIGKGYLFNEFEIDKLFTGYIILIVGLLSYIVLHELVHGIAYYVLTKQKLTFGLKWSCAFCGVPNIYTYRKTALISLLAPFTVFSIIYLIAMIVCLMNNSIYYIVMAIIFSSHISGCVGDLYMTYILLTKYKDSQTLMKDTGPEQWIYVKSK